MQDTNFGGDKKKSMYEHILSDPDFSREIMNWLRSLVQI